MALKYTGIWQFEHPEDWSTEILGKYLDKSIYDGKHEIILQNSILFDRDITRHSPQYYQKFSGTNSILVHMFDETFEGGYDRYRHFSGVLRWHWSAVFNNGSIIVIPNGYRERKPDSIALKVASERKFVWSFSGQVSKASRPDMRRALMPLSPHHLSRTDFEKNNVRVDEYRTNLEYYSVLADSMFAPSPMGNVILESYRIFEALECGTIPIVERRAFLDYYKNLLGPHPIPTITRWSDARRIIRDHLDNPQKLNALQEACILWWQSFKLELQDRIGDLLERSNAGRSPPNVKVPSMPYAIWRYLELMKHHNLPAFRRRLGRQFSRVLTAGVWRSRI